MGASPLTMYTFPDQGPDGTVAGLGKLFNDHWDDLQTRYKESDEEKKQQYKERFDGRYVSMWQCFIDN